MASIEEAGALVRRDPPVAFVAIATASVQPPNKGIIIDLKGRSLLLPDWSLNDWAWYLDLAIGIANKQDTKGDTAQVEAKPRKLAIAQALRANISADPNHNRHPGPQEAFGYYESAVKLVIASTGAASGESRGAQALDAFGAALRDAPRVVLDSLSAATGAVAEESGKILAQVFEATVKGILSGAGIFLLLLGGWYLYTHSKGNKSKEDEHGEA